MTVKVGFLATALRTLGGVERSIANLAKHCDPSRVEWTGIALTEWSCEHEAAALELSRYMPIYGTPNINSNSQLHDHKYVKRVGPDASAGIGIVSGNSNILISSVESKLGVMTNYHRSRGLKVVCVSHSDFHGYYEFARGDGDFLVAVSEPAKNGFAGDGRHIEVIHNGVDVNHVTPVLGRAEFRKRYGIGKGDIVLTYIGRFSIEKNYLATAAAAVAMGKCFKALYVGCSNISAPKVEDGIVNQLKDIAGDQLVLTGPLPQVGDALAASDVLINVSDTEGGPLTVVEAWLAGVPVVSTDVGIVNEFQRKYGVLTATIPIPVSTNCIVTAVGMVLNHNWATVANRARIIAWNELTATASAAHWADYLERISHDNPT